jgi:hypothetical protein
MRLGKGVLSEERDSDSESVEESLQALMDI